MNVLGILQARASSSRLPGKVLKPILGRPMLLHQIDRVVEFFGTDTFDIAGTANTYPDGLDVEVVRFDILERAWKEATRPSDREHVTLMVHRQPERFRVGRYPSETDLSHMRWTVDEPQDFELVRRIYEALYPRNPAFATREILDLLAAQPELLQVNQGIRRNEG